MAYVGGQPSPGLRATLSRGEKDNGPPDGELYLDKLSKVTYGQAADESVDIRINAAHACADRRSETGDVSQENEGGEKPL